MANTNAPTGFTPVGRNGGQAGFGINSFPKTAAIIYQGDLVLAAATGDVAAAGATGPFAGVAMHYAAAADASIMVCDDSDVVLNVQATGATGLAAADMNLNILASFGAGSSTTRQSGHGVDDSTEATTATHDFGLLRRHLIPNNDWGAYVRVLVRFKKHIYGNQTVGI
jgi:hypothetical protein